MKKTGLALAMLLAVAVPLAAQQNSSVSGTVANPATRDLKVMLQQNPLQKEQPTYPIKLDSTNSFNVKVDRLAEPIFINFDMGGVQWGVFVEPGNHIKLNLNGSNPYPSLKAEGTDEAANANNYLFEHYLKFGQPKVNVGKSQLSRSDNPALFRHFMDSLCDAQYAHYETYKESHPLSLAFDNFARAQIDYSWANDLFNYAFSHFRKMAGKPDGEEGLPDDYFSFLDNIESGNPDVVHMSFYANFLNYYISYLHRQEIQSKDPDYDYDNYYAEKCDVADKHLKGKPLYLAKAQVISEGLTRGPVENILPHYKRFMEENTYLPLKAMLEGIYGGVKHLAAGNPAPPFTAKSIDGKTVSIGDFKGKVVYLDFWATWCGPCRKELPHAKELKEKFKKEKDVVFLYLSTDKDAEKWQKFVPENGMTGEQLICTDETRRQIAAYNVSGIPKYFLIDRDGNIADSHAKRPSSKGIEQDIRELLEGKR